MSGSRRSYRGAHSVTSGNSTSSYVSYASKRPSGGKGGKDKKRRGKKPWDKKSKVLLGAGLTLFLIAAIIIGVMVYGYIDARSRYQEARERSGIDISVFDGVLDGIYSLLDISIDWDALREINPDIVGWIYVENTDIDYPIVQGEDNDYYLSYSFDGTASSSGCIFLDCDAASDMTSANNLIYGHNMLDGSMFAQLLEYKDQEYLNQNYRIIIVTPTSGYLLSPAFTYVCSGSDQVRQIDFSSDEEFQAYITDLMGRSVTESIVDLSSVDKLFSLVTCSYEANDTRTVLCCVQTEAVTYPSSSTSTEG